MAAIRPCPDRCDVRPSLAAVATAFLAAVIAPSAASAAPEILMAASTSQGSISAAPGRNWVSLPASTAVTWFTDRPGRRAGHTTLRRVAAAWSLYGFRADPPNAAVVVSGAMGTRTHVVELGAPTTRGARIIFRTRPVADGRVAGRSTSHPIASASRVRLEMFIDDVSGACGGFVGSWTSTPWGGGTPSPFLTVSPACDFVRHTDDGDIDVTPTLWYGESGRVAFRYRDGYWWVVQYLERMSAQSARWVYPNLTAAPLTLAQP